MKHNPPAVKVTNRAFTLIELLTVIAIIAVLMGLLFPAVGAAREAAKKTQAKSDMANIVNAIKAYYTEYGKYPCNASTTGDANDYFAKDKPTGQDVLMNILRSQLVNGSYTPEQTSFNPRRIVFLDAPMGKDINVPANNKSSVDGDGVYRDPWANPYLIRIDSDYSNSVNNPYSAGAGFNPVTTGVIMWSLGKDGDGAVGKTGAANKTAGTAADDVLSWQ